MKDLTELARALREATHVCVLTGSGISAESGVPTFRDAQQGLWARHEPTDLATPEAFARDPDTVWQWYRWRRRLVAEAEPNPGHHALAELASWHGNLALITQNVDGLHQRAGHPDVIEFHGNIHRNLCHREGKPVTVDDDTERPPTCPQCGAPVRPGVVWFGESIPQKALDAALDAAGSCELFIAIGTSATVYPAAGLAEIARDNGRSVVEINPDATPMSDHADLILRAPAGEALSALLQAIKD